MRIHVICLGINEITKNPIAMYPIISVVSIVENFASIREQISA